MAFALARVPRIAGALAALSIAIMLSIATVSIDVPPDLDPVGEFVIPHLAQGHVSVNAYGLDDYLPEAGDGPLNPPLNSNSFNLGEVWFPGSWLSLAPLLAAWAGIAAVCLRPRPERTP